jgi:hypothetical protein
LAVRAGLARRLRMQRACHDGPTGPRACCVAVHASQHSRLTSRDPTTGR